MFSEEEKRILRDWARGKRGHFRRTCPHCSHQRTNTKAVCLSVEIDHEKALYTCHHCEAKGGVRLEEPVFKPSPIKRQEGINKDVAEFLKSRGISQETGMLFGCIWARAYFPDLRKETGAIGFAYTKGGNVLGYKLRSLEQKAHACTKALKTFYGLDQVDTSHKTLIICEGEIDSLSYYEAGIPNAVSVPNGAQSLGQTDRSGFLWEAREIIDKMDKIIIASDNDEAGERMADEISRRIGKHRCYRIEYPEACKDANDVLCKYSKERLVKMIDDAKPWPIAGLYEASKFFDEADELFINGFEDRIRTGMESVDTIYSVGKGLMTVVTGIPGNGKSTFVDQLMLNLARMYGYKFAVCSFENPPAVHQSKLAEMLVQRNFHSRENGNSQMTQAQWDSVKPFLNKHFYFMQQDDGSKADIPSIIERIKTAVFRYGINGAVIDPYNYVSRPKDAENETQFIDDLLTQLRLTASSLGIHLWFVAHPTKMQMGTDGQYQIPRGYSISGSAAWYSKADFGITVHRTGVPGEVKIINWKTRFNWLGKEGEVSILYDNSRNSYMTDIMTVLNPWGE